MLWSHTDPIRNDYYYYFEFSLLFHTQFSLPMCYCPIIFTLKLKFNTSNIVELKRAVSERYEHQHWPNVQKKSIIDEKISSKCGSFSRKLWQLLAWEFQTFWCNFVARWRLIIFAFFQCHCWSRFFHKINDFHFNAFPFLAVLIILWQHS